jgi:hypothetical protein
LNESYNIFDKQKCGTLRKMNGNIEKNKRHLPTVLRNYVQFRLFHSNPVIPAAKHVISVNILSSGATD